METTNRTPAAIHLIDADARQRQACSRQLAELGYRVHEFDALHASVDALRVLRDHVQRIERLCLLINVDQATPELSRPDRREHLVPPEMAAALRELGVPAIYASAHAARMRQQAIVKMGVMAVMQGAVGVLLLPFDSDLPAELERAFDPDNLSLAHRHADMAAFVRQHLADVQSQDDSVDPEARNYQQALQRLTPTERVVHDLMLQGLPSKTIARDTPLSLRMVHKHRSNVLAKMGVGSTPALLAKARAAGERATQESPSE